MKAAALPLAVLTLTGIAMASSPFGSGPAGGALPPSVPLELSEITVEAIALARQDCPAAHEQLRGRLLDTAWLHRLNAELEYVALGPPDLQLYFILEALAANPSGPARETLGTLAADARYATPGPFLPLLLEASKGSAEPPEPLIALWASQLATDASELARTIDTLVANGSAPAIRLFEQSLLERDYREDYVVSWLRDPVLRHRQDLILLQACHRLLESPRWRELYKTTLVEVLFDYQPKAWYHPETPPPQPPSRSELTEEARQTLLRIADAAQALRKVRGRIASWRRGLDGRDGASER
jgi:hypothetical protein